MYLLFSHKAFELVHEILILIAKAPIPKIISIIYSSNDNAVFLCMQPKCSCSY